MYRLKTEYKVYIKALIMQIWFPMIPINVFELRKFMLILKKNFSLFNNNLG